MPVPAVVPHMNVHGEAIPMNEPVSAIPGNIVKTFTYGNSTVHICDDYMVKTPEENQKIWDEYNRIARAIWRSAAERSELVQAYYAAETEEEKEALVPALLEAGWRVVKK
jgi:hypothetical protein